MKKCDICGNIGKNGARFTLEITGCVHTVHKPCGERAKVSAPSGVDVKLYLNRELMNEANAEKFWREKFRQAEAKRAAKAKAA